LRREVPGNMSKKEPDYQLRFYKAALLVVTSKSEHWWLTER